VYACHTSQAFFCRWCKHPNVVAIIDALVNPFYTVTVAEKAEQTLHHFLKMGAISKDSWVIGKYGLNLDQKHLAADASAGLAHVHMCKVLHLDIHPGNVFVFGTRPGQVRLAIGDFGLACFENKHCGNVRFVSTCRPPEMWLSGGSRMVTVKKQMQFIKPQPPLKYSYPADVWALGCLIAMIAGGMSPGSLGIADTHTDKDAAHVEMLLRVMGRPSESIIWRLKWSVFFESCSLLLMKTGATQLIGRLSVCKVLQSVFSFAPDKRPSAETLHKTFVSP
jgi:serine/threonine protein kinase